VSVVTVGGMTPRITSNGAFGVDSTAPPPVPLESLTTAEANHRLVQVGPNALPDTTMHPVVEAAKKFCAPVII
jgi:hypothetical protein